MKEIMNMGFYYTEGVAVGYCISCPNAIGGKTSLRNVSYRDKGRIVNEMVAMGHSIEDIEVDRRENF